MPMPMMMVAAAVLVAVVAAAAAAAMSQLVVENCKLSDSPNLSSWISSTIALALSGGALLRALNVLKNVVHAHMNRFLPTWSNNFLRCFLSVLQLLPQNTIFILYCHLLCVVSPSTIKHPPSFPFTQLALLQICISAAAAAASIFGHINVN